MNLKHFQHARKILVADSVLTTIPASLTDPISEAKFSKVEIITYLLLIFTTILFIFIDMWKKKNNSHNSCELEKILSDEACHHEEK